MNKENIAVIKSDADGSEIYHFEAVRKCSGQESNTINTSWEYYASFHNSEKVENKTPPYVSIMVRDNSANRTSSSTQTETSMVEPEKWYADLNLSFNKDFKQESTSNDNSEHSLGNKRYRCDSYETDNREVRPLKKTKCDSCASSTSDLTTEPKQSPGPSVSSRRLSSTSETSFKSIDSTHSYKIRKRRPKSDTSLFREAVQRSRKSSNMGKRNYSQNNTPGGSGTPRRERSRRRTTRTNSWRLMDFCTWIGKKSYQSITGLYTDMIREPNEHNPGDISLMEEVKEMRRYLNVVNKKQERLEKENDILREEMTKMMTRIDDLEGKLRRQESQGQFPDKMPPPPPPPPPPPLPAAGMALTRANTIPRCGSAPSRSIVGPRLSITPQDIANVKLRKTKDNPVRSKPPLKNDHQPLVTQQMLQTTRAKLARGRPVAASTPKQQLLELEKCLLQESSATSLFRRRVSVSTFRSTEELRARPYPASRGPRSPRSNSLPRRTPLSPLKLANCAVIN